jgi:acetylornithine/succinyldiaminopimelate/putrescine aminotransferase
VHVLADELLRFARERCDEVGATLIFDEIQTGLGRTGTRGPTSTRRRRPTCW